MSHFRRAFALTFAAVAAIVLAAPHIEAQATLAVPREGVVDIYVGSGRVEVTGWDRNELSLEGHTGYEASTTSSGAQIRRISGGSGNTLRVRAPHGARLAIAGTSADVRVDDVRGDIDVRISSGDVTLLRVGRVTLSGISGDVRVESAADVRIRSSSGDMVLRDVRGQVDVRTTSGDVQLQNVDARSLTVETMSGDVLFAGTIGDASRSLISTHSGDVRLHFARDMRALIELRTFNGRVTSESPLTLLPSNTTGKDRTRRLQMGAPGGPVLDIQTFSGNITIVHTGAR